MFFVSYFPENHFSKFGSDRYHILFQNVDHKKLLCEEKVGMRLKLPNRQVLRNPFSLWLKSVQRLKRKNTRVNRQTDGPKITVRIYICILLYHNIILILQYNINN